MSSTLKRVWIWLHVNLLGAWKCFEETFWDRQPSLDGLLGNDDAAIGKVAVITGGNRGIGFEAVKKLLGLGCTVLVGVRDPEKADQKFRQVLSDEEYRRITSLQLDLTSTSSVRSFAQQVLAKTERIHILINNGGIMFGPRRLTEEDGFESQMATNYLGHFLLTVLLLKRLRQTADADKVNARIVNVSSVAHLAGAFINVDDLTFSQFYSEEHGYCCSKACQVMFTKYLSQELKRIGCNNVTVNSLHPGVVKTDLYDGVVYFQVMSVIVRYLMKTPSQGGDTLVHAAISPSLENQSGIHLENCHPSWTASFVNDKEMQKKLWQNTCNIFNIDSLDA